MRRLSAPLSLAALALLAACGGSDESEAAGSGEVLEGTISDAMLPFDRLTSQPPLADPAAAAESAAGASADTDEPAADAEAAGDAEGAGTPAAEETPEADAAAPTPAEAGE